jgi:uncharacterized membrane protein (UPF0127 family)
MRGGHFVQPLVEGSPDDWSLAIDGRGVIVAPRLEGAFTSKTRNRGLLGRDAMPADLALIIAPCTSIHTIAMRFAIDVIYVRRDGRVMKVVPAIPPMRLSAALGAFAVVEMAAGAAARSGVQAGDRLTLVPRARASSGAAGGPATP